MKEQSLESEENDRGKGWMNEHGEWKRRKEKKGDEKGHEVKYKKNQERHGAMQEPTEKKKRNKWKNNKNFTMRFSWIMYANSHTCRINSSISIHKLNHTVIDWASTAHMRNYFLASNILTSKLNPRSLILDDCLCELESSYHIGETPNFRLSGFHRMFVVAFISASLQITCVVF